MVQAAARGVCPNAVTVQAVAISVTGYGDSVTGRPRVECDSAKERGELVLGKSAVDCGVR